MGLEEKLTKSGIVTEAVNTKVTTRQTYVLTGIEGDLKTTDGKLSFIEKDGIDYAPTTVQLPGGEFGGVFVHKQPSDTDLGSKTPKEVLLKGEFFAAVS